MLKQKNVRIVNERSDEKIAAPLEDIVDAIYETIHLFFERAVEVLSYCSEDGGYLGKTYDVMDAAELLEFDITSPNFDKLNDDIFSSWDGEPFTEWCSGGNC